MDIKDLIEYCEAAHSCKTCSYEYKSDCESFTPSSWNKNNPYIKSIMRWCDIKECETCVFINIPKDTTAAWSCRWCSYKPSEWKNDSILMEFIKINSESNVDERLNIHKAFQ